jgi:sulfate permease, SulP family
VDDERVTWRRPVLPGLDRQNLVREMTAGLSLLALAVPLNIGYAQIAGLPPTAGLYAMIVPCVVFALFASSRQVVASPDAAIGALVGSSLTGLAVAGSADYVSMALAQAILCGLLFVAMSVLKLGFMATFLSKPILVGFVAGLALDVLVSQVAKMLGISLPAGAEFVDKVGELLAQLAQTSAWSAVLAVASLSLLLVGRRLARPVPWALLVLVLSTLWVTVAGLSERGVSVVGPVESGPPTLTIPSIDLATWLLLIPSAAALTLITTAEGLLVSRSYGDRRGYRIDPDRDLMAFGAANTAAGLTGGFSVGASVSRTAAMDQAGSRTQLPSVVAAVGALLLVAFGTGLLEQIPSPAIGAIVALAVLPLLGVDELRALWRHRRFEFAVAVGCLLGVLALGPIRGIAIAVVLSLVNLARRASSPHVDVLLPDAEGGSLTRSAPLGTVSAPGVVVLRFGAPLFFANGLVLESSVREAVTRPAAPVHHLVLDLEAVSDIDVTAAESLERTARWLDGHGVGLAYSRLHPVLRAGLETFDLLHGHDVYPTSRDAVRALAGSD